MPLEDKWVNQIPTEAEMLTQFDVAWSFLKADEDAELMAEIQRQLAEFRSNENVSNDVSEQPATEPQSFNPSERKLAFPKKRNKKYSIPIRQDESNEGFKLGPSFRERTDDSQGSQMQIEEQKQQAIERLKNKLKRKNEVAVKRTGSGTYADDEHAEVVRQDWLDSMSDDERQRFAEHEEDFNTLAILAEMKRQGAVDQDALGMYGENLASGAMLLATPESQRDENWNNALKNHKLAHAVHNDELDNSFDGYDKPSDDVGVIDSNKQMAEKLYGYKEQEDEDEEDNGDDLLPDDYVMPGSPVALQNEKKEQENNILQDEIARQIAEYNKNMVGVTNKPQYTEEDYEAGD
jgi:hypothetical protein